MISVYNTGCHLIYQYVQCDKCSACMGDKSKTGLTTMHARHASSLVRNYFVTKDIAWDFEIKNHESFSIMGQGG